MTETLVIGRFQLVGNNHVNLFEQIIEHHWRKQKVGRLNVGIGVADEISARNPFSGTECWQMVKPVVQNAAARMEVPFRYRLIDDLNDPPHYADHVLEHFGMHDDAITLFSSNSYTTDCFQGRNNCTIVPIEERLDLHASQLRALYTHGADISTFVPSHIPRYLREHEIRRRLQKLTFDNPIPTVDVVIEYQNKVVIIKRKEEPLGYALVRGHIDPGESSEQAAVREAEEETGLQVQLTSLIGVYSKPGRDPRPGHRISIAYAAIGSGAIKAGSDAEKVILCDPDEVPSLLFDHNQIFQDYRTKKGQNL